MYDVIVIGAGPAGVMASIMASKNSNKVLLLEKNNRICKKLEISGGGRCNLTNLKPVNDFLEEIPVNNKMLYSTLNNFGPKDIVDYFTRLGLKLKVEDNDRVFPISNSSATIIDALHEQLLNYKVKLNLNEAVLSININDDKHIVITSKDTYSTKNIIIATGGFSYTYTGSTGDGYRMAKKINQDVTSIYPAETFIKTKKIFPLSGMTLDNVNIEFNKHIVPGPLLFTHVGLSGPTIFKISGDVYKEILKNKLTKIILDFIPEINEQEFINKIRSYEQKKDIISFVKTLLPKRLVDYLFNSFNNQKLAEISKEKIKEIITILKHYEVEIIGTGTIEQSIVTGGGVDLNYINTKTFESKKYKGLYFVGEVLDIHGHTGGYNITLALSTGYTAGSSIKENK